VAINKGLFILISCVCVWVFFSYLCCFSLHNICSDNRQISGKVLVYRNPGLHFGDIHILKATYVKALESFIGNAKYAIFFPCKGPRSLADEIAGGDFDGDMYWVSRNLQVGSFICFSFRWFLHFARCSHFGRYNLIFWVSCNL
jgi:hypothetical protein